jgi:hypothetical protein
MRSMPLSRSAAIRFAFERTVFGIAENWAAIAMVVGLCLFGIMAGSFLYSGPVAIEPAAVLGVDFYEDRYGPHPIVRVRLSNGSVTEVVTTTSAVRECREGSRIWLLRRAHSLAVDPGGCSPRPV